jgi:hypothetical protein
MQIVNRSYFQKQNFLNIPLATPVPYGIEVPSNQGYLDMACIRVEREVLLRALGVTLWKQKEALTADTIQLPENLRWLRLIEGEEYRNSENEQDDELKWNGLKYDYSLIAYRVFEEFTTDTNIRLTATGASQVDSENAVKATPMYLISTANNNFIKEYQGETFNTGYGRGYNNIYGFSEEFLDYFDSEVERCLYAYLVDKKADFPEWDYTKFRFYDTKNSFGL